MPADRAWSEGAVPSDRDITETFHARMPTPDEIRTLALLACEPVMVLHRRTFASDGRPIEFACGVHAALPVQLVLHLHHPRLKNEDRQCSLGTSC